MTIHTDVSQETRDYGAILLAGIDFETYSNVDLPKHGLDRYMSDPSTRPLLCGIAMQSADGKHVRVILDFVHDPEALTKLQEIFGMTGYLRAHNAQFEDAMLRKLLGDGFVNSLEIIDSAVSARIAGASSSLAAASTQLLGKEKMAEGVDLIRKFSMPNSDGSSPWDNPEFRRGGKDWSPEIERDWVTFIEYCVKDAVLCVELEHLNRYLDAENEMVTARMNRTGWPVDMDSVHKMQRIYLDNLVEEEANFFVRMSEFWHTDEEQTLNFNSPPQLMAFCRRRKVAVRSLDQQSVTKTLDRIEKRLAAMPQIAPGRHDLLAVRLMLHTKQVLGGSSLKKLQTIIDQVGPDDRLRYQYVHCGAGQSWRTSGRGVQMQNLKRLSGPPWPLEELLDSNPPALNFQLAANLRQLFCAESPEGSLVVGDFKSVESRGLAYLAGEEWVLDEYRKGTDVYQQLAARIFAKHYDDVTKDERQTGKVGQLSCGYGAGGGAVQRFAEKMGVVMEEAEAAELVSGWRAANPHIVDLWTKLNDALQDAVHTRKNRTVMLPRDGWRVVLKVQPPPPSILKQRPDAVNIEMVLQSPSELVLRRTFTGVYAHGRDICYMKPSSLKSGNPWIEVWHKDGMSGRYKLYGGKLTGILVQSFCREIFFDSLRAIDRWVRRNGDLEGVGSIKLIGQFHDEIVLETSNPTATEIAVSTLENIMSTTRHKAFPLEGDVHAARRYIK